MRAEAADAQRGYVEAGLEPTQGELRIAGQLTHPQPPVAGLPPQPGAGLRRLEAHHLLHGVDGGAAVERLVLRPDDLRPASRGVQHVVKVGTDAEDGPRADDVFGHVLEAELEELKLPVELLLGALEEGAVGDVEQGGEVPGHQAEADRHTVGVGEAAAGLHPLPAGLHLLDGVVDVQYVAHVSPRHRCEAVGTAAS